MEFEYVIVDEAGCLVLACGEYAARAEEALARITAEGKKCRIEKVEKSACWWNDPVLCR